MIFWEIILDSGSELIKYLVSFQDLFEGCDNYSTNLKMIKSLNKFACTSYAKSYLILSFFGKKVRQLNFLKLDCRVASRLCLRVFLIRIVSKFYLLLSDSSISCLVIIDWESFSLLNLKSDTNGNTKFFIRKWIIKLNLFMKSLFFRWCLKIEALEWVVQQV